MAIITKSQLESAFLRLSQLAVAENETIELLLLGGGVMVLAYGTRPATKDVDVVILAPQDRSMVRRLAEIVAREFGWSADWLNEGAKGYLVEPTLGETVFKSDGLTVRMPRVE